MLKKTTPAHLNRRTLAPPPLAVASRILQVSPHIPHPRAAAHTSPTPSFNNPTPPPNPPFLSHYATSTHHLPRSAIPRASPPPSAAMATVVVPSPSSPVADDDATASIPTATLALPSVAAVPRRLPPPCWTPDETSALIDAYRDKWYSLRRGNLRANHWQDVAADVAARCPVSPAKTAVQCRHKMEKLRKRYRAEIQRSAAHGGPRRHASSWAHFHRMHAMERGPNPSPPSSSSSPSSDDDDEGHQKNSTIKRVNDLYSHHNRGILGDAIGSANVRIKIPGRVNTRSSAAPNPSNPYNPGFANFVPGSINGASTSKFPNTKKRVSDIPNTARADSGVGELVAAIRSLGEGFMRMEKVKMDMARQMEEMRMEMELKRTEMILESEQRIVEAFAMAGTERSSKRPKRNSPKN